MAITTKIYIILYPFFGLTGTGQRFLKSKRPEPNMTSQDEYDGEHHLDIPFNESLTLDIKLHIKLFLIFIL